MEQKPLEWRTYQGRHPLNFELQCKNLLREAMKLTHGNRMGASRILGLSRITIRNWIIKYGLTEEFRELYGEHPLHSPKEEL